MVFPHCIFKTSGGSYIVCTFWLNVVFVVVIYVYASLNPNIIMYILCICVSKSNHNNAHPSFARRRDDGTFICLVDKSPFAADQV